MGVSFLCCLLWMFGSNSGGVKWYCGEKEKEKRVSVGGGLGGGGGGGFLLSLSLWRVVGMWMVLGIIGLFVLMLLNNVIMIG